MHGNVVFGGMRILPDAYPAGAAQFVDHRAEEGGLALSSPIYIGETATRTHGSSAAKQGFTEEFAQIVYRVGAGANARSVSSSAMVVAPRPAYTRVVDK